MTTAYWCVLIIILMPYPLVLIARAPDLSLQTNRIPRLVSDQLTGYRQRLNWAHLNALEAVAPFAAVVIIAHQLHASQAMLDGLALGFVGLRVLHALVYAANLGVMRSLVFVAAFACIIGIFLLAAGV